MRNPVVSVVTPCLNGMPYLPAAIASVREAFPSEILEIIVADGGSRDGSAEYLRAQNLIVFLQLADGIDDETWEYHRRRGDYSRWFAEGIKDEALTREAERIEAMQDVPPLESRALMRQAIEKIYTLPA